MALDTVALRNPQLKLWATEHLDKACRLVELGTPIAADDNRIVTIANMKNTTSYTIAAQPDVCRRLSVTHATVAAGTDTLGTLTFIGTDINGQVITEVVTPLADSAAYTTMAYDTVTSIIGSGWVIAGGNDTIIVGVDDRLGLPYDITGSLSVLLGVVGTAIVAPTSYAGGNVAKSMVDISSGTFNGSKSVFVMMVE
jgi:hypothetical protein